MQDLPISIGNPQDQREEPSRDHSSIFLRPEKYILAECQGMFFAQGKDFNAFKPQRVPDRSWSPIGCQVPRLHVIPSPGDPGCPRESQGFRSKVVIQETIQISTVPRGRGRLEHRFDFPRHFPGRSGNLPMHLSLKLTTRSKNEGCGGKEKEAAVAGSPFRPPPLPPGPPLASHSKCVMFFSMKLVHSGGTSVSGKMA